MDDELGAGKSLSLYTRHDCPLCEHLVLALELMRARFGFSYTKIDVDSDPALAAAYGSLVPVLSDDDHVICSGHCDPAAVESYLNGGGDTS